MTLLEIVAALDSFDRDATIYCREPWTGDSPAIVAVTSDSGTPPEEARRLNFSYFLEIDVAAETLAGWTENTGPHSVQERCDRLIQYAINDA